MVELHRKHFILHFTSCYLLLSLSLLLPETWLQRTESMLSGTVNGKGLA